jgi:hypothetical protein
MISKMVSLLKQNMHELHKYYMTLYCRDHFLLMFDTQNSITRCSNNTRQYLMYRITLCFIQF